MATVRDVVHGALRRIGVLSIAEEADAETASIGLAAYNAMHREAALAGWLASWVDQGLNDALTLGDAYAESAKAAVAVRIAPDFQRPVDMRLGNDAALWMAQIAAAGRTPATFERGFRHEDVNNAWNAET